jgi:hypothetical protein
MQDGIAVKCVEGQKVNRYSAQEFSEV